jgi:hypothetical protein
MTGAAAGQVREPRPPRAGVGPAVPGSGESTNQPFFDENARPSQYPLVFHAWAFRRIAKHAG